MLLMVMFQASLVHRIHWCCWLQPGAPLRHHPGRHVFTSTLQLHAMVVGLPAMIVFLLLQAMVLDQPWTDAVQATARQLPLLAEWAFALAFCVALASQPLWTRVVVLAGVIGRDIIE